MTTLLLLSSATALAVIFSVLARRKASSHESRRQADVRRLVDARADWKRRFCNVVVEHSPDGRLTLKRDGNAKHVLVDHAGNEWRLYWGIGEPATGSYWDAFETRMMGMLSQPDWIGFHCEAKGITLVHVYTETELKALSEADPWFGQRAHSVTDIYEMLGRGTPLERRSGRDRRSVEDRRADANSSLYIDS